MKANVINSKGKSVGKIDLPKVFKKEFRPDVIKRAFLAVKSMKRQPYGSDVLAGKRTSADYHGRRRIRYSMMMRDMARLPRLHGGTPFLSWRVRRVPSAVKGRRAHPPKVEKKWEQKINKKEMELAFKSAIAATANIELVKKRGHRTENIKDLPLIIKDIESIKKTSDVKKLFISLGLEEELNRTNERKVRSGKGKMRGRKYKKKIGPLVIIANDDGIIKACKNLPGVDARIFNQVSIEDLSPGANAGRLTIWSRSSIEKLSG
jgi:large subunit ribosomal protein L4e